MKRLRLRITSAAPETQPGFTPLLLDATPRMRRQGAALTFATNQHGYADLRATIPMSLKEQFRFYDRAGTPQIAVTDTDGGKVWSGRVEDVQLGENLLTLGAYGYWRAFSDTQYTALWSDTRVSEWAVVPDTVTSPAAFKTQQFQYDIDNRLYITLPKNTAYGAGDLAGLTYAAPGGGGRTIVALSFDYVIVLPTASWSAYAGAANDNYSSYSAVWTLSGTGATQTGSVNVTFTGKARILIGIQAAANTIGNETGVLYIRITNVRVKTTTAASVTADLIAKDLVATVAASNPYQLSTSTALIQSPGLDLRNELFEDATPADILNDLIRLGGNTTPPTTWECGVYDDQALFYRPTGSAGRTWTVDIDDLQLNRSISTMTNQTYARYQDANGRTLRTSVAFSSPSITRYLLTRQQPIDAQTTDATTALLIRSNAVDDNDDPKPRASIPIRTVYTTNGKRVPKWTPRAGDTIRIRNLPPNVSSDIDRIRVMRLSRTNYDAMREELTVEPEEALPLVDVLLAQKVFNG